MSVGFNPNSPTTPTSGSSFKDNIQGDGAAKKTANGSIPDATGESRDASVPFLKNPSDKFNLQNGEALGGAITSLGANLMALITNVSAEQKRENAQQMYAQSMANAKLTESQGEELRSKAITQMVMGVVGGTVSIGFSLASTYMSGKQLDAATDALSQANEAGAEAISDAQKAFNDAQISNIKAKADALNVIGQGSGKILDSFTQFGAAEFDVAIKNLEAQSQRIEALSSQLKSLNDALTATVDKSIETSHELQRSMNESLARIVG